MQNSRKSLFNILYDNILNIFVVASITLIVLMVMTNQYVFITPLTFVLASSVFTLVLDIKKYSLQKNDKVYHVLVNDKEVERNRSVLNKGDIVYLYQYDEIDFICKVTEGIIFVDEQKITGSTKLVKKTAGEVIMSGSIIANGTGFAEILNLEEPKYKRTVPQSTKVASRMELFNAFFALATIAMVIIAFVLEDNSSLSNVAQTTLVMIPGVTNFIITIVLFLKSKSLSKVGVHLNDLTALSSLSEIDVACFDKTGTLTTGGYEIYKAIPIVESAFASTSIDANTMFEQVVSNVIKTNGEKGGYLDALADYFTYDVSGIATESSAIRENGLYSVASFKGGKTYAVGEVDKFEYSNPETVNKFIAQFKPFANRILMLVESKNPLKSGLIDGKVQGIGIIVVKETIRKSILKVIEELNKKKIPVIILSGDDADAIGPIANELGINIESGICNVGDVELKQTSEVADRFNAFSFASDSHKASIIKGLRKKYKNIAYFGNGDNDIYALRAANTSVVVGDATDLAKRNAQMVIDNYALSHFDELSIDSKVNSRNINSSLVIQYSQSLFALFYIIAFGIAHLIDKGIINPFEYVHLLTVSIFGIYLPVLALMLDKGKNRKPRPNFRRGLIAGSTLLISAVGAIFILQLLQYNCVAYFAIPSDYSASHDVLITSQYTYNLSYLVLLVASIVIFAKHMEFDNGYRVTSFFIVATIPASYLVCLGFGIDTLSFITQINTSILTLPNYVTALIVVASACVIYLVVLNIIEIVKGEIVDVKSKPRS